MRITHCTHSYYLIVLDSARSNMQFQEDSRICAFISQRTVFMNSIQPATLVVIDEKIQEILYDTSEDVVRYLSQKYPGIVFNDYGSLVLMPGIVDSHVHVNEPGRTEWEGFHTATQAAAAGGVTTIADMPLNSIPPTTTLDNLKVKAREAYAKTFVDVAFWGGVIPGNQHELRSLIDAGIVGFKCFLCPSGVDEFPHVSVDDVKKTILELLSTKTVLAFHAEFERDEKMNLLKDDPGLYDTFLHIRPDIMELDAVKLICDWCIKYNFRCHIVHLSSAECLALIKDAKTLGAPLTVETCYHYLVLAAEEIPAGFTEFKCCPPIRKNSNREQLWHGVKNGTLDMIVSDHSPCVSELKTSGNFLTAWGGISSLQFGLPLIWTAAKMRGIPFFDVSKLLSNQPAKLCGLEDRKGDLSVGKDADFVIWDPEESIKIEADDIYHKNKLTPYQGKILFGKVIATVLRGRFVFKEGKICDKPLGKLLLNANILQTIKTQ
ncbi:PREDICTED: allantoinase, mitochondrial isoform X1 [Acromyrmex echinatior]|uniref:allantoinase, mitochondrial isoform X1 n=2 Tax=Acromyrmex echinatior TaxID=103372 RepID=UPI000580B9FA|nr:PREDICTED: allantoinase, mitochondrial isoform X1 [Acromyrmex echinatior]